MTGALGISHLLPSKYVGLSHLLGGRGARKPDPITPPAAGTAPQVTDPNASAAATDAGLNQAKYGQQGTILTGGQGVTGATVQRPQLLAAGQAGQQYPTLFAKYLE